MFNILKAVFGGTMLFLGRDLDWLFAVGLGALVGIKATTLLDPDAPMWMSIALVALVIVVSVLPYLVYQESKFIVSGFLFGGYALSEFGDIPLKAFFNTSLQGSTWLIFFVGAVIGAVALGLTQEWGMMFATALVGAFLITSLFPQFNNITAFLVAGGLFILGGLVQILILNFEKGSEK